MVSHQDDPSTDSFVGYTITNLLLPSLQTPSLNLLQTPMLPPTDLIGLSCGGLDQEGQTNDKTGHKLWRASKNFIAAVVGKNGWYYEEFNNLEGRRHQEISFGLSDVVRRTLHGKDDRNILELGCGSGVVSIALLKTILQEGEGERQRLILTDGDSSVLPLTKENCARNKVIVGEDLFVEELKWVVDEEYTVSRTTTKTQQTPPTPDPTTQSPQRPSFRIGVKTMSVHTPIV